MHQVAIRDLKARLSEVLRDVQNGQSITITAHRKPVARIEPLPAAPPGLPAIAGVSWRNPEGIHLGKGKPVALEKSGQTVSELLLDERHGRDLSGQ